MPRAASEAHSQETGVPTSGSASSIRAVGLQKIPRFFLQLKYRTPFLTSILIAPGFSGPSTRALDLQTKHQAAIILSNRPVQLYSNPVSRGELRRSDKPHNTCQADLKRETTHLSALTGNIHNASVERLLSVLRLSRWEQGEVMQESVRTNVCLKREWRGRLWSQASMARRLHPLRPSATRTPLEPLHLLHDANGR